jgi:MATE family multidrug resistance protein
MIFSNITVPLLGLVDTAVIGHLDSPVYLAAWRLARRQPASSLCCCFFAHEHHRADGTGFGAKDPLRLARALVQPLILALGAGR